MVTSEKPRKAIRIRLRPDVQVQFERIMAEGRWSQTETAAVLVDVYRAAQRAGLVVDGVIREGRRRRKAS